MKNDALINSTSQKLTALNKAIRDLTKIQNEFSQVKDKELITAADNVWQGGRYALFIKNYNNFHKQADKTKAALNTALNDYKEEERKLSDSLSDLMQNKGVEKPS